MENTSQSFYRITGFEFTDDGRCLVYAQSPTEKSPKKYNLVDFAYRSSWLSNFKQPDLETIWQLARRQPDFSAVKRGLSYGLYRYYALKRALRSFDDERAVLSSHDFDDW